ncbi:MAG: hypothetical protein JSV66_15180 [Trueperaceae bacterium]|nr:MAG: hypothetical protein JSV66_15180 [Trueperaceae bacterium]
MSGRLALACFTWLGFALAQSPQPACSSVPSTTQMQLRGAMAEIAAAGFDLAAPANGVPLQAKVFYHVARDLEPGSLLLVPQGAYYGAFLDLSGQDPMQAPAHLRVPFEYGQDYLLRVEPPEGSHELSLTALGAWPVREGGQDAFAYTAQIPGGRLEVVQERVTHYQIDYLAGGELVRYRRVSGVSGFVAGGPLGLLFEILFGLLGNAEVLEATIVTTPSGRHAARVAARLGPFKASASITVAAAGEAVVGLAVAPDERERVREQLERTSPVEVREVATIEACLSHLQSEP